MKILNNILKISIIFVISILLIALILISFFPLLSHISVRFMQNSFTPEQFVDLLELSSYTTMNLGSDYLLYFAPDLIWNPFISVIYRVLEFNIVPFYFAIILVCALLVVFFSKKNSKQAGMQKVASILLTATLLLTAAIAIILFGTALTHMIFFTMEITTTHWSALSSIIYTLLILLTHIASFLFFLVFSFACVLLAVYINIRPKSTAQPADLGKANALKSVFSLIGCGTSLIFAIHCIVHFLLSSKKFHSMRFEELYYINLGSYICFALILATIAIAFLIFAIKGLSKPKHQENILALDALNSCL